MEEAGGEEAEEAGGEGVEEEGTEEAGREVQARGVVQTDGEGEGVEEGE